MEIHITKKKIIIASVILFVVIIIIILSSLGRDKDNKEYYEVKRDTVVQSISESGVVKKGEIVELGVEVSGVIKDIKVSVGDEIRKGNILAYLDDSQYQIQLIQAQADLDLAQSQLDKLISGATEDEIELAYIKKENKRIAFENSEVSLEHTKKSAEDTLDSYYNTAISDVVDSKSKVYNALVFCQNLERDYFHSGSEIGDSVIAKIDEIETAYNSVATYVSLVNEEDVSGAELDFYLTEIKNSIYSVKDGLDFIKERVESDYYRDTVASADKTILDTHIGYISTEYATVLADISNINTTKSTNEKNISTAKASRDSAYYAYKQAEKELEELKSPPREEDLDYYQAQVRKYQQSVNSLFDSIAKTRIKSPINGIISDIEKQEGEVIQTLSSLFEIIPDDNYYIQANIYEEDLPKIDIGDKVEIELVAYHEEKLEGAVFFIDPSEEVIADVVYYPIKVSIEFYENIDIKPGMSADISVITETREDVLIVPSGVLNRDDGKYYVLIMEDNGRIEEKEIEIGLWGSNDRVEIVEGLSEGDKLLIE